MRVFRLLFAIFLLPLAAFSLEWENGEKGIVTQIIDGDSLILDSGLKVRLAQIEAPHIKFDAEEGNASREFLQKLALNKKVRLKYGGLRRDKMGRALAQVFIIDKKQGEIWVNIEILRAGRARVHTYIDNRKNIGAFWAAEREARRDFLGIWANPKYQARHGNAPDLIGAEGSFQLVEGKVLRAINQGGVAKLCFGENSEKDFCALIPKASWELFSGGINEILGYENRELRIRGRVQSAQLARESAKGKQFAAHGPQIWLDHPEQIEFIIAKK